MQQNTALQRMRAGKPATGAAVELGSPLAAEYLASAGFDFVMVDNQHGIWDDQTTMQAFRGIYLGGSVPYLRVQCNDYYVIGRALDRGALGVIVPMVNSVEEARAVAYATHYPPRGGRSLGPVGVGFMSAGYKDWIEGELFVAVQIESRAAAERAEEILSVDGIDGCWVGPSDLALSMGVDVRTPEGRRAHEEAILHVIDACHRTGKIPGLAATPENVQYWMDRGMLFLNCCMDMGFMQSGAAELLTRLGRKG
jgi:4-hydroxy-2-oxoheptanedioate aldolase